MNRKRVMIAAVGGGIGLFVVVVTIILLMPGSDAFTATPETGLPAGADAQSFAGPGAPPMGMPPLGGAGGPGMGGRAGEVAAFATPKHLFISQGGTLYQLDVDTLEIKDQLDLPEDQEMGPF